MTSTDGTARDDQRAPRLRSFRAGALSLTIACSAAAAAILGSTSTATAQNANDTTNATPKQADETSSAKDPTKVEAAKEYIVFQTSKGQIVLELDRERAPITVRNFLAYVNDKSLDGTIFHRVVPNFVIQGGGFDKDERRRPTKEPIENEWTNGLKNKRGTISMARTNEPNSATNQFFISLKDNDMLDQPISGGAGYAVFGKVVAGMAVVDMIAGVELVNGINGPNSAPKEPILIEKAREVREDQAKAAIESEERKRKERDANG